MAASLRSSYLVGCDGGRSVVRKAAGIEFPGWDATTSSILAEAEMAEEPPLGIHRTALGMHAFGRDEYEIRDGKIVFADEGPIGVMVTERNVGNTAEPTLRDLSEALVAACGTDYGIHSPTWISRFTDMSRQAAAYRKGRVLLAGDAAHVHSPVGGQGLNTGVQDAVNLGWKLAQVVKGTSPEGLLDTYHAERHPVAARVLRTTMAQVALQRPDDRTEALREIVAEFLGMEEPRKRIAAEMSGLGIHYDLGEGHPLVGRRMPDFDLRTPDGPLRTFELLKDARPVLLNLGAPGTFDITPWSDRIKLVGAGYDGPWELPALGLVSAPTAVLIRPDGYVAWVGAGTLDGLLDAMNTWCGSPGRASVRLGLLRRRHVGLLLASLQPHVVDGMLDGVEARAFGKHPAGEDAPDLAVERDLVDLDEGVGLRLLFLGPRIADARRHLQCAELDRLVDIDVEGDDAAGDLVDAGELGHRVA